MMPSAKSLILDLLSALRGQAISVSQLVSAAKLFSLTENSLRVALARLLSRGLVKRDERGQYRLAEGAEPVQSHVASWTDIECRMTAWSGGWIGVQTSGVQGATRAGTRRRQRALDFLGFRQLEPYLRVRPDNLSGGISYVRVRLYELGLQSAAPVFCMTGFDSKTERRARGLWDVKGLLRGYRGNRRAIARSSRRLERLSLEEAAVEVFILGGEALRQIVLDPLLPEPIIRTAEFRSLVQAMRGYDLLGRAYWQELVGDRYGCRFESLPKFSLDGDASLRLAGAGGR